VCSRAGLWLFDLCVRQLAQECIPESHRGRVNGQWKSVVSLFDMMSYVVAMVWSQPEQFVFLTTISATMVAMAFVTYTISNCSVGKEHVPTSPSPHAIGSGRGGYTAVGGEDGGDIERAMEVDMPAIEMEMVPHVSFSTTMNPREDRPEEVVNPILGSTNPHIFGALIASVPIVQEHPDRSELDDIAEDDGGLTHLKHTYAPPMDSKLREFSDGLQCMFADVSLSILFRWSSPPDP
jgi:hypothetical protein